MRMKPLKLQYLQLISAVIMHLASGFKEKIYDITQRGVTTKSYILTFWKQCSKF